MPVSDARPPMLTEPGTLNLGNNAFSLYCLGQDIGENLYENRFMMVQNVLESFTDFLAEEKKVLKCIRVPNILLQGIPKDIYTLINHYTDAKDIWDNVKMILEGSELTKNDRESQLYDEFERFCQIKGETIHVYYVRFITEVKLNRGLKESNFDQLYAYLKQHEVHANENRMMMERFIQPTDDPLALVSNASNQKYPTQSYESPQFSNNPSLVINCQKWTQEATSTDNLIESLTNTLASSERRHISEETMQEGNIVAGNVGGQNRVGNMNPGQAKPVMCYNYKGIGHIARESDQRAFDSDVDEIIWDEYHEVHEMQSDYVEDNAEHVVQSNVSSVRNDALMSILDEMHEQGVQSLIMLTMQCTYDNKECVRVEIEEVKQHYKELFESIQLTRASTNEQTSSLLTQIEDLKAQLEGNLKVATRSSVKTKVLAPGMYAIDVEPIPPRLKNNRNAHLTYINHLKESVETVREIVEEARVVKPLDNALNYACKYTKLSQELLEYVIGTCPKGFNERDNKAPSTPVTRKKQVTLNDKPGTSSSNTQKHEVHQKVQQTNVPMIHSTGVSSSTRASGSKPRSNTKHNRILPAKSVNNKKVEDHPRTNNSVNATPTVKIVLNKGKQIWKPKGKLSDNSLNKTKQVWKATGKLFANVGYQWRPTGKKFTSGKLNCGYQWRPTGKKFALGELCPLTRLPVTCTTVSANHQDPNTNWGSEIPNPPNSTVFK
ncbi:hypothetical protein Tco_1132470 [Tanacetum coccineum]|uniref:Uncharacterized protein n=1 Tax=Tanacetum coccineum TaxID=301880 RepID=A0ABQ5JC00_9ASTR